MNDFIKVNSDNIKYIEIDIKCYTIQTINQTIYKFCNICVIEPRIINDNFMQLLFYKLSSVEVKTIDLIIIDFFKELADQKIRSELDDKFSEIRNIIVKKAFSPISMKKE